MSRVIASFLVAFGLAIALLASERFVMAQAGPYGTLMGVAGGGVAAGGTVTGGQLIVNYDPAGTATNQASLFINMPSGAAATDKALAIKTNDTTDRFSVDNSGAVDVPGLIESSGSATCSGVGTAGAVCMDDTNGTVVSGSGAASPFIVEAKANTGVDYLLSLLIEDDPTNFWVTLANGTGSGSLPALVSRGTTYGLMIQSGVTTANDAGSTHIAEWRLGRENGTRNSWSFSAPSTRPLLGISSGTTNVFGWHINGRMGLSTISPTNLSGDVNNYAGCTTTSICRINDGGAGRNVTGITPAYTATLGDLFFVCSVGSNNLTLVHQSASSSSANRFTFNGATNRTVLAGSCFPLVYDVTSATWRAANGT